MLVAVIAPVLIVFALPIGKLTDRGFGFKLVTFGFIIGAVGQILFSLTDQLWLLGLFGALKSFGLLMMIVIGTWIRNLMPVDDIGKLQGVRLIFMVMIPMVIDPAIGSYIIETYGTPTTLNGESGFIPVPLLYQVSAVLSLTPLIPIYFLKRRCHQIDLAL